MKKFFLFSIILSLAFTVTACSGGSTNSEEPVPEQPGGNRNGGDDEGNTSSHGSNGRYLILYCSRTSNTVRVAEQIRATLDCDILEVEPETPYDNDYSVMLNRAQQELAAIRAGNYPSIKTSAESFEQYDTVFVGYPIWYGSMATPMQTFLHRHRDKLTGKHIALFATSGSSGISSSVSEARSLCSGAIVLNETLHLTSSSMSQMANRVTAWLEQIGAKRGSNGNNPTGGTMKITVGSRELTATLVQNSSTEALKELLKDSPLTIDMHDYGNMEKVGGLGKNLPANDERITTEPGDIILYQGSSLVIYYAPNTWTFTRLGKINDVTQAELKATLGSGDVRVTLSLTNTNN
jgi:flavodoxin